MAFQYKIIFRYFKMYLDAYLEMRIKQDISAVLIWIEGNFFQPKEPWIKLDIKAFRPFFIDFFFAHSEIYNERERESENDNDPTRFKRLIWID